MGAKSHAFSFNPAVLNDPRTQRVEIERAPGEVKWAIPCHEEGQGHIKIPFSGARLGLNSVAN